MIIGTVRAGETAVHDSFAGYHQFHAEPETEDGARATHGSFEIFHADEYQHEDAYGHPIDFEDGWYWWACFPGCSPDGEAHGPFATSRQALLDADEWNPEFDEDFEE